DQFPNRPAFLKAYTQKEIFLNKILIFSIVLVLFTGCGAKNENNEETNSNGKEKVTFMLDWVPNTNHTGIFVAKEKGFYDELNIDIEIINPPEESVTALVTAGKANFGISFQDSIAMALNENEVFPVVAVAGIIQHNTSGLLSLKEKGIETFKDLEGKTYATWGNDIEQATIKQVMENENGNFENVELYYSTVTDAVSAMQTNVDAVWVYEAWDAMMAKVSGIDYNFLRFSDVEPALDFYSPVLISNEEFLNSNEDLAKRFLEATKKGYEFAIENPEEAAEILHKYSPEYDLEMLIESQKFLSKEYKADAKKWGYIDEDRWNRFFSWLYEKEIIKNNILGKGFSNDYLPE
ncbi:MAG: ABC transporter substrate-binding protein, partial [Eubacteriales bacterium]|nr:ABC transporter substrate-binding protein [Eubacteriales bacterium]